MQSKVRRWKKVEAGSTAAVTSDDIDQFDKVSIQTKEKGEDQARRPVVQHNDDRQGETTKNGKQFTLLRRITNSKV